VTRLRSPAQRAPQTVAQATALATRYAVLSAQADTINARRAALMARANGVADAALVPIAAELKDIAKQLKPWWAASIDELTGGKRKSVELGGCTIGYRISPPKVVHDHGKDGDAVEVLIGSPYESVTIRVSHSLDKPAILKLLDEQGLLDGDDGPDVSLASLGFRSKQTEDFFIDVIAPVAIGPGMGGDETGS